MATNSLRKKKPFHSGDIFEAFAAISSVEEIAKALREAIVGAKSGSREQMQAIQALSKLLNRHEDKNPNLTDGELRDMSDEMLIGETLAMMGVSPETTSPVPVLTHEP